MIQELSDPKPPTPPTRALLRLSAIGMVLLAVVLFIPFWLMLGALALTLADTLAMAQVNGVLALSISEHVAGFIPGYALFVLGAIGLRQFLNRTTGETRSPETWGAMAWLLCAPFIWAWGSGVEAHVGPALALSYWVAFAVALIATWLELDTMQLLWSWRTRSQAGAATISLAAALAVVGAAVALSRPAFREQVARALPRSAGGSHLLPSPVAVADDKPSASALRSCYEQLAGDACDDAWNRTLETLGRETPAAREAVHDAWLYVCASRAYAPPNLCSAFHNRAAQLKADGARYQRRSRDQPATAAPACPAHTAEDSPISQEELNLLYDALARIDPRSRQIIELAYGEQLTDAVIGTRLVPALGTVRVRGLRREAEQDLRALLARCR
jgi:DNA-directed RNA polymerase specialized sigma24 family protein